MSSICRQLHNVCNWIFAEMWVSYPVPGVNVEYLGKASSSQRNGLFDIDGVRGIVEGRYYMEMDPVPCCLSGPFP